MDDLIFREWLFYWVIIKTDKMNIVEEETV